MDSAALSRPTLGGFRHAAERIVPPVLLGFMPIALAIVVVAAASRLPEFL